jgi:hypothetical protein
MRHVVEIVVMQEHIVDCLEKLVNVEIVVVIIHALEGVVLVGVVLAVHGVRVMQIANQEKTAAHRLLSV